MVTATFNLVQHTLMVNKAGNGIGVINSSPLGIICGSVCGEAYAQGAVVTLTASPAEGSTFTGWSGVCSGTGLCTVTITAPPATSRPHSVRQEFHP